jgi:hypothetical protein
MACTGHLGPCRRSVDFAMQYARDYAGERRGTYCGSGLRHRLGQAARTRERGVERAVGGYAEGRAPDAPTHSQLLIAGRNTRLVVVGCMYNGACGGRASDLTDAKAPTPNTTKVVEEGRERLESVRI